MDIAEALKSKPDVAVTADEFVSMQEGALLWIACLVHKRGGEVCLTDDELKAALSLTLERGEAEDGSVWLRTA